MKYFLEKFNMFKFRQYIIIFMCFSLNIEAQIHISGQIRDKFLMEKLPGMVINIQELPKNIVSDSSGVFHLSLPKKDSYTFNISGFAYKSISKVIRIESDSLLYFDLEPFLTQLEGFSIKAESKWSQKATTTLAIDQISNKLLNKNPSPSIFESLATINGISPQITCSVCNSSELSINGLAGAYTMILIDGMPLISSLARTYGLNSIPLGIIDKIEIIKGAASTQYGSEALGGIINIITKSPSQAPTILVQLFKTSLQEHNLDFTWSINRKKIQSIIGGNLWLADSPKDINRDNFTDFALAKRFSFFNKWKLMMPKHKTLDILLRAYYEDRWGGEINWQKKFRGGDEKYGESIQIKRIEVLTNYEPFSNKNFNLKFAYFGHEQDAAYGTFRFHAKQHTFFGQAAYNKKIRQHEWTIGLPLRYNYYDDNSFLTTINNSNKPEKILSPALFVQHNLSFRKNLNTLSGIRLDFHPIHGLIYTPQFALKWTNSTDKTIIRTSIGKGFRVVNLFTEEHAALSGAREIKIPAPLRPEQSWNFNINIDHTFYINGGYLDNNFNIFYTHFSNQILPDYTTNPNLIIFNNLVGYAASRGFSYDATLYLSNGLTLMSGFTLKEVFSMQNKQKEPVLLTDKLSGVWTISYKLLNKKLEIDYTGNIRGAMKLPLLNQYDPRPEFSKAYSIQNLKFNLALYKGLECFWGIKNILNFNPTKGLPFMIARANDPFDKHVIWDSNGYPALTPENPYGLTFDPSYIYAPLQGRNFYIGLKFQAK